MSRSRPRRSKARRCAAHTSATGKRCPTPSKLAFNSREHAESTLRYWNYDHAPYRPERAYLCGCGKWHLTSRPEQRT
ncbi:hypothetical protein SEA_MASK_80 [Mycobacterium phage Mask]|nr:hypothetical protein SEA_SEJANUS_81 [Mycobacterium phage Sejanus]UVT31613.1 hypothetical protein SEA_MASK_80 [Mycobacterium phage Mask]